MKRFVVALLALMLFMSSAMAEGINLSEMPYEDLADLKKKIEIEFNARPEAEPFTLQPGGYIVGKDLKAGDYYIMVDEYRLNQPCVSWYGVYSDVNAYKADEEKLSYGYIDLTDNILKLTLENENYLQIRDFPILFSIRELSESEWRVYTIPEGTYVPAGLYTIGEDIPAGKYKVYMATLEGYDIFVYEDQDAYTDKNYMNRLETMVIWSDHVLPLGVVDGNVVKINKDVIMVKQEKPAFTVKE